MNLDPEIAAALAATPALTNPAPPPEGVSEIEHARQELIEPTSAYTKFYAQKLPENAEGACLAPPRGRPLVVLIADMAVRRRDRVCGGRQACPGGGWGYPREGRKADRR